MILYNYHSIWFYIIIRHIFSQGSRYKLTYDGMYHLDIPKTRQYDHGKIEVIARSSVGESRTETTLTVKPRSDDYRGVLKNSPRRKFTTPKQRNSYIDMSLHSLRLLKRQLYFNYTSLKHILFFYFYILQICTHESYRTIRNSPTKWNLSITSQRMHAHTKETKL